MIPSVAAAGSIAFRRVFARRQTQERQRSAAYGRSVRNVRELEKATAAPGQRDSADAKRGVL